MDANQQAEYTAEIKIELERQRLKSAALEERLLKTDNLTETLREVMLQVELLSQQVRYQSESFQEALKNLQSEIKAIKEKPEKRVDQIMATAIGVAVTAVVTFVLVKLGFKA